MVPFAYLASVCWSLQCLISALTQVGRGGLLFRFASSVLLQGRRDPADRYCCVWVALTVFRPHCVCPRSRVYVLSMSILLRLLAALYGACPALYVVLVFVYSTKEWTWLRLRSVPSPSRAAQAARSLMGTLSPGVVHLLPPAVPACFHPRQSGACALCLAATQGGCQPSRISGSLWLETGGLFAVW